MCKWVVNSSLQRDGCLRIVLFAQSGKSRIAVILPLVCTSRLIDVRSSRTVSSWYLGPTLLGRLLPLTRNRNCHFGQSKLSGTGLPHPQYI